MHFKLEQASGELLSNQYHPMDVAQTTCFTWWRAGIRSTHTILVMFSSASYPIWFFIFMKSVQMCAVNIVPTVYKWCGLKIVRCYVADTIRFEVVSFIMLVLMYWARFNGAYVDLINCAYTDRITLNFSVEWVLECTYTCIHWQIQGSCTYTVGDLEMWMRLPLSLFLSLSNTIVCHKHRTDYH